MWKGIKKLREEGYEIEAVTNRGYRLTNPETMYNKRELEQGLKTKTMGQSIYFYEETDTTNNRARELALEGAPEGTLVAVSYTHLDVYKRQGQKHRRNGQNSAV